ncbi:MAG TPA: nucleotidyltransferase domain-containing protein [Actinomycetota bacterium]|jgi:predicted nucleotidyltransferase|nr:nucleotidyltransferase domain-containing protein [Actinomycetota bacterium]
MMGEPIDPTDLRQRLRERRSELLAAAARRGASNLRIFGSVARGDDSAGSDIDFLVDFEASRSVVDVAGLILDLQGILGVPVDVIEASTLRPGDGDILAEAVALESA